MRLDDAPTEKRQWQIWLWPDVVLQIKAEVILEDRGLPGMRRYSCLWNDFVYWFWKAVGRA